VIPLVGHDTPGSAADQRLAASSTFAIPEGFLQVCVLASRRQRLPEGAMTHERNH
jgi:hypothetical protein